MRKQSGRYSVQDAQYTQRPPTYGYGNTRPKLDVTNKFSILGILVGFVATILLGLLYGILVLVVVGVIIYFATNRSPADTRNYFMFGSIAALVAYLVLIVLISASLL